MSTAQVSYPAEAHRLTRELEDASFWYRHRTTMIIKALQKYVTGKPVIYDLGGGNGPVTKALMNEEYPCVLVEAMPDAIIIANERNIEATIQSSIQDFKQTSLPVVVLADVLEHIEDDAAVLKQLYEQIISGGTIIITVPAFEHLTTDIDKEIGHYRRYRINDLSKKLMNAGFVVSHKTYFFSLLYLPFLLFRVLPYKFGVRKRKSATRRNNEHLSKTTWLNKLALKTLQWEADWIGSERIIPFGTSCLLVAKKP
ncbi:class I SAM-dependent methyltransferase [Ferruginibacter lapsinanis]|uniref:class I SAM-dependent methyltransferase n=1 Tax=Ferruginibacter lapsinanis TaxID=563172 RepID=UPI001E552000|nr:methyltransferase domain-containing protein [Ferruginibacter lapsinanis]UEG50583.1 class I SAM-dependent methyltransferase [Ferruginibacter lapsinanis]